MQMLQYNISLTIIVLKVNLPLIYNFIVLYIRILFFVRPKRRRERTWERRHILTN
jgi:hypothetical protein